MGSDNNKKNNNGLKNFLYKNFTLFHLTEDKHFNFILTIALIIALTTLATELNSSTAYGRFGDDAVISLDPRLGWFLMELPCK